MRRMLKLRNKEVTYEIQTDMDEEAFFDAINRKKFIYVWWVDAGKEIIVNTDEICMIW